MPVGRVIQVSNITPSATKLKCANCSASWAEFRTSSSTLTRQTLKSLRVRAFETLLVCFRDTSIAPISSRVCFVQYRDPESCSLAHHLTNTVFIDRALIVAPIAAGGI